MHAHLKSPKIYSFTAVAVSVTGCQKRAVSVAWAAASGVPLQDKQLCSNSSLHQAHMKQPEIVLYLYTESQLTFYALQDPKA